MTDKREIIDSSSPTIDIDTTKVMVRLKILHSFGLKTSRSLIQISLFNITDQFQRLYNVQSDAKTIMARGQDMENCDRYLLQSPVFWGDCEIIRRRSSIRHCFPILEPSNPLLSRVRDKM